MGSETCAVSVVTSSGKEWINVLKILIHRNDVPNGWSLVSSLIHRILFNFFLEILEDS